MFLLGKKQMIFRKKFEIWKKTIEGFKPSKLIQHHDHNMSDHIIHIYYLQLVHA